MAGGRLPSEPSESIADRDVPKPDRFAVAANLCVGEDFKCLSLLAFQYNCLRGFVDGLDRPAKRPRLYGRLIGSVKDDAEKK